MHEDARAWRTGPWRVDAGARALYRDGVEIPVPPKALSCLIYLVAHHHRAVGRDELINAVWGHAHLSDGALAQTIFQLRGILAGGVSDGPIRSLRGFGYRWVAPVAPCDEAEQALSVTPVPPEVAADECVAATPPSEAVSADAPQRRFNGVAFALGTTILFVLLALASWLLQDQPAHRAGPGVPAVEGGIVDGRSLLVMPVESGDTAETTWMRLGLMDLVASRLRAAGAVTVPVETALMLDRSRAGDADRFAHWSAATGAQVVMARVAHANAVWVVHIDALQPGGRAVRVMAEASDAVAAAREAADRLALALGHVPAPVPGESAAVQALLQQVDAALLERDLYRASALIASATPDVRLHPRLRMSDAIIAFHRMDLDVAKERLRSLVDSLDATRERRLWAQASTSLASVHAMQGQPGETQRMLERLSTTLDAAVDADLLGVVQMNLGLLAQERGDLAEADLHLARARQLLEGVGDLQRQSVLASNLGVQALRSERLIEAGIELDRARSGFEALGDRSGALHVLSAQIELHLARLDLPAAEAAAKGLQTGNGESLLARTYGQTVQVMRLLEQGRLRDATTSLDALRSVTAGQSGMAAYQAVEALLRLRLMAATHMPALDRLAQAERARELLAPHRNLHAFRAEAWHALVKSALEAGEVAQAQSEAKGLLDWAGDVDIRGVRLRALMANLDVARHERDDTGMGRYLDHAWMLLDDAASPWHWLVVAEATLPWLADYPDQEARLLRLAQRLSPAASHHFGAACARVRLLEVLGPDIARASASAQMRTLAGERSVPVDLRLPSPDLRAAQQSVAPPTH